MTDREQVEARLLAYIRPNEVSTAEERAAFDAAAEAQLAWERRGGEELPPGVESLTIGSYSVKRSGDGSAVCSLSSLSPAAWAILTNAGLLRRTLPQAKRI